MRYLRSVSLLCLSASRRWRSHTLSGKRAVAGRARPRDPRHARYARPASRVQASTGVAAPMPSVSLQQRRSASRAGNGMMAPVGAECQPRSARPFVLDYRARSQVTSDSSRQPGERHGQRVDLAAGRRALRAARECRLEEISCWSKATFNTTQDLSLPLWGVVHGGFTLNWLLSNPYNNHLRSALMVRPWRCRRP